VTREIDRRGFLASAGAAALAGAATRGSAAMQATRGFPKGFLWGAATAAHQVEGNNVNNDNWVLEHVKPTLFAEPSGDACDHYHRYADDIKLLAGLGFNTYRFSIEWARIEPEEGFFSRAELDHYRRMLAACHESHLTPMVTFNHFTLPRWLAARGGWEHASASDLFARYCERAARHLGDLIAFAATLNEPNIPLLLHWLKIPISPAVRDGMLASAARAVGSDRFGFFLLGPGEKTVDTLIAAHHRGMASAPGTTPAGSSTSSVRSRACRAA